MSFDRLVSSWTDFSTSTGSSAAAPNLVLPAPMVGEWKHGVTAREIRNGLFYEANLVLNFFHFILSLTVLISVLIPSCPSPVSTFTILLYLTYYMFISSWNGGSSKTRHLWLAMMHPHFLVHCAYIVLGGGDQFLQTAFTTYAFIHVFFVRLGFHPYIACFINDPLILTRVRVGLFLLAMVGISLWSLNEASLLSTPLLLSSISLEVLILAGVLSLIAQSVIVASRRTCNHLVHSPLTDVIVSLRSILRFRSTVGMTISSFLRLLDAHIDPIKTWCDAPITLDTLIEWLSHERGVSVWQFITQFKTYRLGKDPDPSDTVPQDILDAVEAGRRERWLSTDSPLKSPLLRGH